MDLVEIEAALTAHPLVESAAVIGLPDDDLGNRVHAIVQLRSDADAGSAPSDVTDVLVRHAAEHLVSYKIPSSWEFVDTPLRDEAGKVRRSALRAERLA